MILLVHGGLWEPMDADKFWVRPGIAGSLPDVLAPDRLPRAPSWEAEAEHLAALMPGPAAVVAGSNGCSAAVRLALARPELLDG